MTRAFARRRLTAGERAIADAVFDGALRLDTIRILAAPSPFKRAFVPGRGFEREWIVWPVEGWSDDFSTGPLRTRSAFVHELVHVWQAQQGVNLALAKLKAGDGVRAYAYTPDETCRWVSLNIEQQAMVVEHAYRLSQGATAPAARAFYRSVTPFSCGLEGA
ncbi:hypothetical protein [Brevundimonas sp.]|uniref:hypothetical protein n=1 Tax=Brevundimonas sp. TaxID=1871086 RepID=UPI0025FCE0ED|nr:hypothetical protein [Brevundimonas sp.]